MHQHAHAHSLRDFFSRAFGGALAGASIVEEAFLRATWARAQAPGASANLFKIEKVADGVYAALARPQVLTNCNAAIFVNSQDVLVVDAHSKPSAAAALIAQIKKDVTTKPVRYLVNSHFHWDHTQGDAAYMAGGARVDIIASEQTKQLMTQLSRNRLKESLDGVPQQIDEVQVRLAKATSDADKERYRDLIRQLKAYQAEMQNYTLELPTITFDKSHVVKDAAGDLHIEFHGRAHTAGDIAVFSPQKRVVASGDSIIGFLPNINDGYPRQWPGTINSVGQLAFDHIIPGHGPVHHDRARMTQMRNCIEELTGRVEAGKKTGRTLAELQKTLTLWDRSNLSIPRMCKTARLR
jgi:glyoxylase-like metal-dependent hydrolase (beta-lactamase superfamily II)